MRAVFAAAIAAAAAAATALAAPAEQPCTLIGCESGVTVAVDRLPPRGAAMEVCAGGRCRRATVTGTRRVVFVPVDERLAQTQDVRVRIRVFTRGGRVALQRSQLVKLRAVQPNGAGCPPVCYQASLRVAGTRVSAVGAGA